MRIGFDLDDVLCNILDPWLTCLAYHFKINNMPGYDQIKYYYFEECFNELNIPMTREETLLPLDFVMNQINLVQPYQNTKKILESFSILSKDIMIVTSRDVKYRELTRIWVNKWLGNYQIFHVPAQYKSSFCEVHKIDVFLEDKLDTAVSIAKAGIKSFLLDRPWNQSDLIDGVIRIYSLKEFQSHLLNMVP